MDLTPFVDGLRRDLLATAEVAGTEARAIAERLITALDAAVRLALIDALSAAAEEITADLAPGSVEVRLRGREPELVVVMPPPPEPVAPPPAPPGAAESDDGTTARISLRLPDALKGRIEQLADDVGVSVNSWLVRALNEASVDVTADPGGQRGRRTGRRGNSISGWAR